VDAYPNGDSHQHYLNPSVGNYPKYTVTYGQPEQEYGDNLRVQGNCPLLPKGSNIITCEPTVQEPLVCSTRTSEKEPGRKQEKWSGGEQWQKNPYDS